MPDCSICAGLVSSVESVVKAMVNQVGEEHMAGRDLAGLEDVFP